MCLSDPILTGAGSGRAVDYGHGSSAELKIAGEQSGGDCGTSRGARSPVPELYLAERVARV